MQHSPFIAFFYNFISLLSPWVRQIHLDVGESRLIWLKAIWKLKSTTLSAWITSARPSKCIRNDSSIWDPSSKICLRIHTASAVITNRWKVHVDTYPCICTGTHVSILSHEHTFIQLRNINPYRTYSHLSYFILKTVFLLVHVNVLNVF